MRCYLVRHAQTMWNGENRIQGQSDIPLSRLGLEQARCLGRYFACMLAVDEPIRALYTSALARSIQTAQTIAQATGLIPLIRPALAEISLGAWEGMTPEEVDARFQGAYQRWREAPSKLIIPGAEPLHEFRSRIRAAFAAIVADHQDREVIVVSHGGVIASLLADCLGADYDQLLRKLALDNAGISALNCRAQPPDVLWVNATAHLASIQETLPATHKA